MTALTYGIVTTDRLSWGSVGVLAPLAAGVVLLTGFVLYQASLDRSPARVPLMPLKVFTLRTLRAANFVIFMLYAAIFGFWFFQSLYMQGTLHYSALHTGIAFVPMTVAVGTAATLAPRLAKRVGARWVLVGGMLLSALGEALLTGVAPGGNYWTHVFPGGTIGAFGLGLALVPATIVGVQGVPAALSGVASGVLNTSRFVGAAIGLAVLTTLATSHTHSEIASGTNPAHALTDGFQLQFGVGAVFCLVGAIAAIVLLRPQRERELARRDARSRERLVQRRQRRLCTVPARPLGDHHALLRVREPSHSRAGRDPGHRVRLLQDRRGGPRGRGAHRRNDGDQVPGAHRRPDEGGGRQVR